jgi:hypothetical protein
MKSSTLSILLFALLTTTRVRAASGEGTQSDARVEAPAQLTLAPPQPVVERLNVVGAAPTVTGDQVASKATAHRLTPTLQMGGSGYFCKLDFPVGLSAGFNTYGVGVYPLNLGVYFERAAMLPYVSMGGTVSVVRPGDAGDRGSSSKVVGATAQARAALGLKHFTRRGWAISTEIGYSPWAAGLVTLRSDVNSASAPGGAAMRGGFGSAVDASFGVDWL